MITINELLESVDLDFEPRFVTKDLGGHIEFWSKKPTQSITSWQFDVDGTLLCSFDGRLKLSEFDGKEWTECIYEVPRKTTGNIKKLGKLNLSGTNMTMNQNTVDTVVNTLNQVIDAVNKHADIIQQIGKWGSSKGEFLWCETLTKFEPDELKGAKNG